MFKSTILIGFSALLLAGCVKNKSLPPPEFGRGDIVSMKIDGRKGTVIQIYSCAMYEYADCIYQYKVRFPTPTTVTDTHLINADGNLRTTPYGIVEVFDYELAHTRAPK